ncbi:MAG TPA: ferrous iron transporter B, partial [Nitrospirae bacterium]|nr:ferrous iron transporter B [Nitrospirota bacterium]HEW81517.1 ferrous iron transporter B [Nitrospirota bacterium]
MHDHCNKNKNIVSNARRISLIGNPNVGKSAIFGLLTGRYVTVSNYPGTTVEMMSGEATIQKEKFQILDTPGVNSLTPMSEDEKVTRDTLIEYSSDTVVQVIAAKNIKRGLYITLQLVEMGVPLVIDLNMKDEAVSRGIEIKETVLGNIFGVDVVSTIAVQKKGISSLKKAALNPRISGYEFSYDPVIEEYISKIEAVLPEANISKRSIAIMILSGDRTLKNWLLENLSAEEISLIESFRDSVAEKYTQSLSYIISQRRLKVVERIAGTIVTKSVDEKKGVSKWLGDITIHPVWGFPFLFLVLYFLYEFVGVFGAGTLVDILEKVVFG